MTSVSSPAAIYTSVCQCSNQHGSGSCELSIRTPRGRRCPESPLHKNGVIPLESAGSSGVGKWRIWGQWCHFPPENDVKACMFPESEDPQMISWFMLPSKSQRRVGAIVWPYISYIPRFNSSVVWYTGWFMLAALGQSNRASWKILLYMFVIIILSEKGGKKKKRIHWIRIFEWARLDDAQIWLDVTCPGISPSSSPAGRSKAAVILRRRVGSDASLPPNISGTIGY